MACSRSVASSLFAARNCLSQALRARPQVGAAVTIPAASRSLATEATVSSFVHSIPPQIVEAPPAVYQRPTSLLATVYRFPTLEPIEFAEYPYEFLGAPLRKDILHRAIRFEGDSHRRGQAHTLWRNEVHGSGKKIRPQKGSGKARLGDKKSPSIRGGGVAHGPRPRDYSTKLPRKIYDLAWRTALSHRYRMGELTIVDELNLLEADPALMYTILRQNHWGHPNKRSTLISLEENTMMKDAMKDLGKEGRVLSLAEVDVKDLLELGRIVFEKGALDKLMAKRLPDY